MLCWAGHLAQVGFNGAACRQRRYMSGVHEQRCCSRLIATRLGWGCLPAKRLHDCMGLPAMRCMTWRVVCA